MNFFSELCPFFDLYFLPSIKHLTAERWGALVCFLKVLGTLWEKKDKRSLKASYNYSIISLVRTSMVRRHVIVRKLCPVPLYELLTIVRRKFLTLSNKVCCQQFLMIVKWQEVYRYDKEKNIEGKGDIARYEECLLFLSKIS